MPRVTRRSVAAQEESSSEEKATSSRGRKSTSKKEPPKAEEVPIGEPQDVAPKRGGRQAAKAKLEMEEPPARGKAAARGRSTSRGARRGKAEAETNEVEESNVEEAPEEKPQGQGQTKAAAAAKEPAATASSRSSSRSSRGKTATKDEEDYIGAEEESEETYVAVKGGRGSRSRSRGKPVPATASPRAGRSRRGRNQPEETGEEENCSKVEEEKSETKKEVPEEPLGKQKTVKKTKKKEKTPSPAKKTSPKAVKPETPQKEEVPAQKDVAESKEEEPMEIEENQQKSQSMELTRKRKLEEEGDISAKRAKQDGSVESGEQDLSDYVIISKEDVPAADSKEVMESAPKISPPAVEDPEKDCASEPTPATTCEPKTDKSTPKKVEAESSSPAEGSTVALVEKKEPVIVPLTEAELAKQYTQSHIDRDETSSTMVEVGSEGPADITTMSVRSLDTSDAVSMDSISTVADDASNLSAILPPPPPQEVETDAAHKADNAPAVVEMSADTGAPEAPTVAPVAQLNNDQSSNVSAENHENNTAQQTQASSVVAPNSQDTLKASAQPGTNGVSAAPHEEANQNSSTVNATIPLKEVDMINYKPSSVAIDSRKFIPNPSFPIEMMDPAFCFSVVSYNILAECHWRRGKYGYTPPEHMELGYRHALMMKELNYLDGDIVCLQEVEPKYYEEILLPAMKARGYVGCFMKRTKDYYDEGEATFVRSARFAIKSSEGISLKDLAYKEIEESELSTEVSTAAKEYLDRADVVMLTQLECQKTGKVLTVANIHVVYLPPAPDVQCIQVACSIKQLVSKAGSDLNPHIICGDFNSTVDSAAYQLTKDGYLTDDNIAKLQSVQALTNTDGSSKSLIHHMWKAFQHTSSNLRSSYEETVGKEPAVTTYTSNQHTCLDYIFFSHSSLNSVGVLEVLDQMVADENGGLPSSKIPSDHLSLKAVFRMK